MNRNELESVARAIVAKGKGILAADESFPTIEKRFKAIDLPSTEANRLAYRELLFTAAGLGVRLRFPVWISIAKCEELLGRSAWC
jgi:fructose-bisphosphate aldolase, class I